MPHAAPHRQRVLPKQVRISDDLRQMSGLEPATTAQLTELSEFLNTKIGALFDKDVSKREGGTASKSWFKLFKMVDQDGTGNIGFDEFKFLVRKTLKLGARAVPDNTIIGAWLALDADRSDQLSVAEFGHFMCRSGAFRGARHERANPNRSSALHVAVALVGGERAEEHELRRTGLELGHRNPAWRDRLLLLAPPGRNGPPALRVQLYEGGVPSACHPAHTADAASGGAALVAEAARVSLHDVKDGRLVLLLKGVKGLDDVQATLCFRYYAAPSLVHALPLSGTTLLLRLRGLRAFAVPALDAKGGLSDPYLAVALADGRGEQAQQTKVIEDVTDPVWPDELAFELSLAPGDAPPPLELTLFDKDVGTADERIAVLPALTLPDLAAGQVFCALSGDSGGPDVRLSFRFLVQPVDRKLNRQKF